MLALQTPGTGEGFYRDSGDSADDQRDPSRADFARLREVAERSTNIEPLGPPPFATAPAQTVPAPS